MKELQKGEYFGDHYQKVDLGGVILTDTAYTHSKVDWHYHQNPYFTYILKGQLFEANKKESYTLGAGSLLFHNWDDAHYNIKPPGYTRGFHIELNKEWFLKYDVRQDGLEGSINLKNPLVKRRMNSIFMETKISDDHSPMSIEMLLVEVFGLMEGQQQNQKPPNWVRKLQELIMEDGVDSSLGNLAAQLQIHPVHLSREFGRYFGTSFGNYVRLLKVNKAFNMMVSTKLSMTEICYECGFSDQSHFISNFKRVYQMTPSKMLGKISRR